MRRKRTLAPHLLWVFASCGSSIAFAQESSEQLARNWRTRLPTLSAFRFRAIMTVALDLSREGSTHSTYSQSFGQCSVELILRTIVPVIGTGDTYPQILLPNVGGEPTYHPGIGGTWGLGDTIQSFFLSPKAPTSNGIIRGAGPVFLYPTATSDILGAHRWGAGPTAVALKQQGPWTVGALANHIWSFADTSSGGADVNNTFIQPFIGYTTPTAFTTTLNSESTYNWLSHRWIVPINLLSVRSSKLTDSPSVSRLDRDTTLRPQIRAPGGAFDST